MLYPSILGFNRHCAPPYATSDSVYASFLGTVIITFIPCSAWINLFGYPLDVPSWTISSLLVMWFLWPLHHHRIKAMSDTQLGVWTGVLLIVQFLLLTLAYTGINKFLPWEQSWFICCNNPLMRYPQFLIGCYTAELCNRYADTPFPLELTRLWGNFRAKSRSTFEEDRQYWASLTDFTILLYYASLFLYYVWNENWQLDARYHTGYVLFLQVFFVVGLTRCGDHSDFYRFFKTKRMQLLGTLSMSIYLAHRVVDYWVAAAERGFQRAPADHPNMWFYCQSEYVQNDPVQDELCHKAMAAHTDYVEVDKYATHMLFNFLIVPPCAYILFYYIEEPIRMRFSRRSG